MERKRHGFTPPEVEEVDKFLPAYDVQAFIAKGGMGAVYMARQKSLDRTVAIKILPSHFGDDAYLRSQFESEAKNMAKLSHANIISVYDYGQFGDQPYIVMEMVQGKSLYHSAHGKKIEPRQAGRIIRDICRGLAHAHEHGILHRDLKPANILLTPDRTPKIGDFGLARHIADLAADKAYGTPGYTAPEVNKDPEAVNESTDLYSVGIMLYELLAGKRPEQPYVPVTKLAGCDLEFDRIICKATDPSPNMRYRSAGEMVKAIDAVIADEVQSEAKARGAAAASRKLMVGGSAAPKRLRVGHITPGATQEEAGPDTPQFSARLVRRAIIIILILFGLGYAWANGWVDVFVDDLRSMYERVGRWWSSVSALNGR